ncbi:TraM recognition domain-containing protein [Escherichia coli]|nr:TraM recognition domain-containing protein [Escherichia coli]
MWSQSGMRKLWSASNVKIYAGGVDEVDFLKQLSDNVGDFRYEQRTVPRGRAGATNVPRSLRRERKPDVSDLAPPPPGRALVFGSGSVPTMMRTVPWMDGRHAEKVRESIAKAEARA